MAFSDILQKLKDAECEEILSLRKAHKEAVKKLEDIYREKITLLEKSQHTNLQKENQDLLNAKKIEAKIQAKKLSIQKKRKIIGKVLAKTLKLLCSIDEREFSEYLTLCFSHIKNKKNLTSCAGAKYQKDCTEKYLKKNYPHIVFEEDDTISGVILRGKNVKYDFTFPTLLKKVYREEIEIALQEKFFHETSEAQR